METTNVKQFRMALEKWVQDELPEQVAIFHQKVTLELLTSVVLRNPVDTGRSRSNWQGGLIPNEEVYWDLRRSPGEVIGAAAAAISGVQPFSVIYLWNNVNYVVYLEDGWSRLQAPQGFVAISIAELEAALVTR